MKCPVLNPVSGRGCQFTCILWRPAFGLFLIAAGPFRSARSRERGIIGKREIPANRPASTETSWRTFLRKLLFRCSVLGFSETSCGSCTAWGAPWAARCKLAFANGVTGGRNFRQTRCEDEFWQHQVPISLLKPQRKWLTRNLARPNLNSSVDSRCRRSAEKRHGTIVLSSRAHRAVFFGFGGSPVTQSTDASFLV